MFQADFSGVIKTILIILLVYFGFKIILRYFGPMLLKYAMKKMGRKFEQQFNQQFNGRQQNAQQRNTTGEGNVSINKKPRNRRKSNKEVGEYIDYEEID
ncbi:MAG: DUF4834 domain-containing protein [Zunongwangia sp.]|jgi:hypothetical protein|nr:DUF4834 family protein [Zunongwangia profunda]MAC64633.1 DUF4834 domain-containing protein [Flavobacteriaceae bacterium]MAO35497.1 DUF4834 domain-containing protein [Zunongwangia sp.]MAG86890.1 DUF4834 domain-containing protein [Flavobacteriaceae bacterium]MAS71407.1 DUF4834 domain-containing protein [Zunongwangia sp.]MCC4227558.1 DUF4834 family protein [Zunongwangia profunda]|tara:strand:- start:105 stop:401 length:297 start_codon:yes stop_codon:yes gene_type:complete